MKALKKQCRLLVRGLELFVRLGWTIEEREEVQLILLDLDILFASPPLACQTDELSDTICYAELIENLKTKLSLKHFRLLEHLTYEIYEHLKNKMSSEVKLNVFVTKHPKIDSLSGHVQFIYGYDI